MAELAQYQSNQTLEITKDLVQSLVNSENQFPVDFDDAWQWLGYSTKQKAKNKLVDSFECGQDYTLNLKVKRVEGNRGGGSTKFEEIRLTVDCFKEMGMLAGTEQGKLVRRYYLECERIVKAVIPAQNDRLREIELELQLQKAKNEGLTLKNSLVSIHGKELALRLMGDSEAIVEVKTVVTEVVEPVTGRSIEILTAEQLKRLVKERTGQNLKSLRWLTEQIRKAGRDDLLVAVTRHNTNEYPIPERLDEVLSVVYRDRQKLIGE